VRAPSSSSPGFRNGSRCESRRTSLCDNPLHDMVWPQLARVGQAGGGDQLGERLERIAMKARHPLGLVRHDQRAHPARVLRGHARRAGVQVAVLACTQPSANMKPRALLHQSAPIASVRAMSNALITLPLAPISYPIAQVQPDQRVVNQQQPLLQRHPHVVDELGRRGSVPPSRRRPR